MTPPIIGTVPGPRVLRRRLAVAICLAAVSLAAAAGLAAEGETLGHPGYLVLGAARDTTAGYAWREGPNPGERSLTWPDGLLVVPSDLDLEPFGVGDLAVPVTAALAGSGAGGSLRFEDGRYPVSEPLLLTDGRVSFYAAAGDLEILGERISYTPPDLPPDPESPADPRAGYIFLAGMVLLVVVLMRRARRGFQSARRP